MCPLEQVSAHRDDRCRGHRVAVEAFKRFGGHHPQHTARRPASARQPGDRIGRRPRATPTIVTYRNGTGVDRLGEQHMWPESAARRRPSRTARGPHPRRSFGEPGRGRQFVERDDRANGLCFALGRPDRVRRGPRRLRCRLATSWLLCRGPLIRVRPIRSGCRPVDAPRTGPGSAGIG